MPFIRGNPLDGGAWLWLNANGYWSPFVGEAANFSDKYAAKKVREINSRNRLLSVSERIEPEIMESTS